MLNDCNRVKSFQSVPDCSLSQAVCNNVKVNNTTLVRSDALAGASCAAWNKQVSDRRHVVIVIFPACGRSGGKAGLLGIMITNLFYRDIFQYFLGPGSNSLESQSNISVMQYCNLSS